MKISQIIKTCVYFIIKPNNSGSKTVFFAKKSYFCYVFNKSGFMQIKHFKHTDIDFKLWDKAVLRSETNLGYAFSWFLDVVSPGWEALISDGYEYVMPLTVKQKLGISYIVQPYFTQQLGIFSASDIDDAIVERFVQKIPYLSYEFNLNEKNRLVDKRIMERPNYILNLQQDYEQLASGFTKNTLRNIEKANKNQLTLVENISIDDFVLFYAKTKNLTEEVEKLLRDLLVTMTEKQSVQLPAVYNSENNIVASVCLFTCGNRLIYLMAASSREGKNKSAMFKLINNLIGVHAGSAQILDFEGSRIEGVARFYRGFGAQYRPYYNLKRFRPSFLVGKF